MATAALEPTKDEEQVARVVPMGAAKDSPTASENKPTPAPVGAGVYAAIAAVSGDLARVGIAKGRSNEQQHYKFRGIDEVYNALAPILARHGLVVLPRMIGRSVTERATKNGGALFYVVVDAEFDLVAASDGSKHTVRTYGEAMDSGDKATNKAMSAAYKYAAMQTFCIPTEGMSDADEQTHDVAATLPPGFEDWLIDLEVVAQEGIEALRAAWTKSQPFLRKFLMDTNNAKWEALKKRALEVKPNA